MKNKILTFIGCLIVMLAKVDEDGKFVFDEKEEFIFDGDNKKKVQERMKKLYADFMSLSSEVTPRFLLLSEIPKNLTDHQIFAFEGFVINPDDVESLFVSDPNVDVLITEK